MLTRSDLKRLILFAAQENHFFFNNKLYDQIDGVSMGSPLGPILANIFMCNFETKAINNYLGIKPLVYKRYVDDCFLIFKTKQLCDAFFRYINKLHPNIKFTKDEESNDTLSFLDILIKRNCDGLFETTIYRKPTFSGLYLKWNSYLPKKFKINLITCLLNRAWRICSSTELFNLEVQFIKDILLSNGYPKTVLHSVTDKFIAQKSSNQRKPVYYGPEPKEIYLKLPFRGSQSNTLKRQLQRLFTKLCPWIKLNIVFHASNKLNKLCKLKTKLPNLMCSHVVYKVSCRDCEEFYIGKTIRRLQTRLQEHQKDINSALKQHSMLMDHNINFNNTEILAKDNSDFRLSIKETLKIQEQYAFNSLNRNVGSFMLRLWSGD
jgi:hypothetical protein